jgi:hypothetical protein
MAERGFSMVNLWWNRGEMLVRGRSLLGAKNMPRIQGLFLNGSRFGNG